MHAVEPKPLPARALYLVALARAADLPAAPCTDLDGAVFGPPRLHRRGHLAAILLDVDPADFSGPAAESNLADVRWLGPRAAHHDSLVAAARGPAPDSPTALPRAVLPARFGTLFHSAASLDATLDRHAAAIDAALDQVAGADEFTLRILGRRDLAAARLADDLLAQHGAPAAGGARYLLAKRFERDAQAGAAEWLARRAADVLAVAIPAGVPHRLARAGARRDDGLEVVANLALLVHRARAADLDAALAAANPLAAAAGLTLELTGPWPAYSFGPDLAPRPADSRTTDSGATHLGSATSVSPSPAPRPEPAA